MASGPETSATTVIHGTGVGRGAAVAPAVRVAPSPAAPQGESPPADAAAAADLMTRTLHGVAGDLRARSAAREGTLAQTLAAAAAMADDPMLASEVRTAILAGRPPVAALDAVVSTFADAFTAAGGYLAERVTDLMSVRDRAVARLLGLPEPGIPDLTTPSVIVADDLSPADTSTVDLDLVAAIVTAKGGPTSHTAIIAGQLGIPCVVGARDATAIRAGALVAVDAAGGRVVVNPGADLTAELRERTRRLSDLDDDGGDAATADGHRVQVLANIGTPADAARAVGAAVEGVGLFRTEVLFLDRQSAPDVDSQVEVYRQVLKTFEGRKVVTRTLDAGADKPLAFATLPGEPNPALGVRGYRVARLHTDLLADQLRALARAADGVPTESWVMAPMVSTPAEARDFAALAREQGVGTVGVMVEVPSAALQAAQILQHVDFLSLGTNDLAQYVMAADRLSADLTDLTDMWQPAVLQLVAGTTEAGRAAGKPVGVCGESAGDPLMALVLTGLGASSLSMAAPMAAAVRFALRHHTVDECRAIAEAALGAEDATGAREGALRLVAADVREALGLG